MQMRRGEGDISTGSRCDGLGTTDESWGRLISNSISLAQRGEISRRGAHVASEAMLLVVDESNANISWQQRAGAIGGGTEGR